MASNLLLRIRLPQWRRVRINLPSPERKRPHTSATLCVIDLFDDKLSDNNEFDDILLQDAMMDVLSEKERICIEMIVLRGFTAQYVADMLGVTKQAVNQCKNRALAKLKDLLQ